MVRPEKSTIELTADLRNINVKMKPMPINAPSTFELGDTITLWCNYPINKDTGIKWTYDKNLFAEILFCSDRIYVEIMDFYSDIAVLEGLL